MYKLILLDIDGTLFHELKPNWSGGSVARWRFWCRQIQKIHKENGYETIFGIATAKDRPDYIADRVLGVDIIDSQAEGFGLKDYISSEYVFFTEYRSKVKYALEPAFEKLKVLNPNATKQDITLVDDLYRMNVKPALDNDFHALLVNGFSGPCEVQKVKDFMSTSLEVFKSRSQPNLNAKKRFLPQFTLHQEQTEPANTEKEHKTNPCKHRKMDA